MTSISSVLIEMVLEVGFWLHCVCCWLLVGLGLAVGVDIVGMGITD